MHGLTRLAPALLLAAACGDSSQTTAGNSQSDTSVTATTDAPSTTVTTATPTTGDDPNPTTTTSSASDSLGGSSTGDPGTTTATASSSTTTTTDSTSTASTGAVDDTGTGSSTDTGTTGDVEACACPDIEVPLDDGIFVLSGDAELWKYFPKTNSFEMLGALDCPGLFPSTFSMAVDRTGFAWVQFTAGELRKIAVSDVSKCEDPGYVVGQQGVTNFGMAFVSNSANDACDQIYGNTYSGNGPFAEGNKIGDFITIDPVNLQLSKLGKTNFDGAEVTGTGDGRAFIFGGSNPSKLVELDKQDGSVVNVLPLGTLEINNGAFAFAFFAGDFYLFTDSDNDFTNSEVTHLDYDDSDNNGKQDLTLLTDAAPLLIVGAGVSTCAPTAPQ
ncbi:hypothetical protein [Nannocystis sp.]|uniref:hypothetical protein n=1 Tax=Nannocystis sp. TaxID=1962667 RepID=UPI0024273C96|nr:hypothetical protein [Nannocystis sp.]MBK7828876.1 hypothetical protein [Nannocystis sp.]MBK9756583.1 hypothetical protein [Nannocystis sp.]